MIEIGTLLQDRYLIEKQIGAGGMGAVYLAVDQRFGSHVAIKETFYKDDELGDAFEREAHLLNSLHHPVLPHVSDYFTENNGHFLVMQYIEGEDLSTVLKHDGAFPVQDVLRWTDSLLDALDYLHSQDPPIIHRDIKPQNLKITPRGDVILLDFGLAKLKSEDTSSVKSVFGYSRKYSPLEQIQGTGTDARSDIFSLGATAYHLLTGKPPIDVLARASEIVVGNPDPLRLASEINSEVPVGVANILNSALALNSAGRFVSAKAMRQALEHAINMDKTETLEGLSAETLAAAAATAATTGAVTAAQPEVGIIVSPETEDFPALDAFAAETGSNLPSEEKHDAFKALESLPTSTVPASSRVSEILPQSTGVVEKPKEIAAPPAANQSRFPLGALVALLIFAGLAAGYFISKGYSPDEANHDPRIQWATPESDQISEQSETVSDTPTQNVTERPVLENIERSRTKPLLNDKNVENSGVQAEKTEKVIPVRTEILRSAPTVAPIQKTQRNETGRNGDIRDRIIENLPVPDIESIFTGRPSRYKNEKGGSQKDKRRKNDGMTDQEWDRIRRQSKQRQNIPLLPF